MRKFLVSAAIIALIAGLPPASAQDREHQDQGGRGGEQHGGPQGGEHRGGGERHGGPQPGAAMQAAPERGGPPSGEARGHERGPENAMRGPTMQPNQPPPNVPANAMRGPERPNNNAMRGPEQRPNNAMRGPGRDFSSARNYHQNYRATQRFHAARYHPPRGYYARRWAWGMTLPALFWSRQYWLPDYAIYDLPPPPFGAIWVRVNDDALLIDQSDGMIITVAYGVFY